MYALGAATGIILIVLIVVLIPMIFYLITLQNTLKKVRPQFRQMPPGQVWLMLIPLFSMVWQFLMVGYIADSLRAELDARGLPREEERPGYGVGLAMAICSPASLIPGIGGLIGLGGLVLWIIYWVKIHNYSQRLGQQFYAEGTPLDSGQTSQSGSSYTPPPTRTDAEDF